MPLGQAARLPGTSWLERGVHEVGLGAGALATVPLGLKTVMSAGICVLLPPAVPLGPRLCLWVGRLSSGSNTSWPAHGPQAALLQGSRGSEFPQLLYLVLERVALRGQKGQQAAPLHADEESEVFLK